ncbi:MAG: class I mannose-6-phosphate isomerase [Christensenellales bacterium]|jgi:mannose-6-phosphate isomerase
MEEVRGPIRLMQNVLAGNPDDGGELLEKFRNGGEANQMAWVGSMFELPSVTDSGLSKAVLPDGGEAALKDIIQADPQYMLGQENLERLGADHSMLLKILSPNKQLPLATHPWTERAQECFGFEHGKTECWYVIDVMPQWEGKTYYLGHFKEGVTKEKFKQLYRQTDIPALEALCHKIPIEKGEMVLVKTGVPHALGPGVLVLELQEPSDAGVRLGTPKPAFNSRDEEKAFEKMEIDTFIFEGVSFDEAAGRMRIPPELIKQTDQGRETRLIGRKHTKYLTMTRCDVNGSFKPVRPGYCSILLVISGSGRIIGDGVELEAAQAEEIFLPAGISDLRFEGAFSALRCFPPEAL